MPPNSPDSLADLSPEQLSDRIVLYAFELSLMLRAATMMGIEVHVDLVDSPDATGSYPRVQVRVGESGWPPIEPRGP